MIPLYKVIIKDRVLITAHSKEYADYVATMLKPYIPDVKVEEIQVDD